MNQMMYKKVNVNKVLYKTLNTTSFNSKSKRFLFKRVKNKEGQVDELVRLNPLLVCRV